jgi:hypothetical protein
LKLNGARQTLVYPEDINIFGGSVRSVKENAEALVVATKGIVLEVNADNTTYIVMSREQNGGRIHCMKFNITFERLGDFK